MIQKLVTFLLESTCTKCIITARNGTEPYLVRYILFKSPNFSVYFHRFMQSDDGVPHDHPWNFYSLVLSGGYVEYLYESGTLNEYVELRPPGSLAYRPAETVHRIEIERIYSLNEIEQAPLTCVILLKRRRVWGFLTKTETGHVWTDWRKYLDISPDDPQYHGSE